MWVPLGADPHAFCVRAHELGHAMWSTGKPGKIAEKLGVHVRIYQVVEDNRIQGRLVRLAGVDLSAGCEPAEEARQSAERAVELGSLPLGLPDAAHVGAHRERVGRAPEPSPDRRPGGALRGGARRCGGGPALGERPPVAAAYLGCVACWLQEQFDTLGWPHLGSEGEDLLTRYAPRARGSGGADDEEHEKPEDEGQSGGPVTWGTMKVVEPPLHRTVARRRFGSRWSASEEGTDPRYVHRILTDGRIFARRVAGPGGAVLIDASGSMSLSSESVRRLVERAPGATIAAYAGAGNSGILKVLARGGHVAWSQDCCLSDAGNGNVVDGPALRWLARQGGPRLWVSDGCVTGRDDQRDPANDRDAERSAPVPNPPRRQRRGRPDSPRTPRKPAPSRSGSLFEAIILKCAFP